MNSYIPVYKKVKFSSEVDIERSLPTKGEIIVKEGDEVVPFTKIGHSKISKESIILPENLKISPSHEENAFIYKDEVIGKTGIFKKFTAPYNGYLSNKDGINYFNQEKKESWLLSGVWGTVDEVIGNIAVRLKTQTVDVNFIIYSNKVLMGELIVFPNPSELLDLEYLENFASNVKDKIVYVGHHIRREVYDKAVELGVGGLIGGSIEKSLYAYTKSQPVAVFITTGFGKFQTPSFIFEFFKTISNRHVFLDGAKGYLRVPVPTDDKNKFTENTSTSSLRYVQKGLSVLIFDKQHFGMTGEIQEVQDDQIYVKLNRSDDVVSTKIPNIYALI